MLKTMVAALLLIGFPAASFANFLNGEKLYEHCLSSDKRFVDGFILGVSDTAEFAYGETRSPDFRICLPSRRSTAQVSDAVCQFLRDRPNERHYAAASTVTYALQLAFPCR